MKSVEQVLCEVGFNWTSSSQVNQTGQIYQQSLYLHLRKPSSLHLELGQNLAEKGMDLLRPSGLCEHDASCQQNSVMCTWV